MSGKIAKRQRRYAANAMEEVKSGPLDPRWLRRALGRVVPPPSIRVAPRRMDRRVFRLVPTHRDDGSQVWTIDSPMLRRLAPKPSRREGMWRVMIPLLTPIGPSPMLDDALADPAIDHETLHNPKPWGGWDDALDGPTKP